MSFLADIPVPERRRDRRTCAYCEASPARCKALAFMADRLCCEACDGNHDQETAMEAE